nr:prepilin-type N-terminal cleavage/methylation domain-containing protein [Desulfobulbaceae bacterium]
MARSLRSQQGFTLIEIIAVLVLLGILAAVAVPKYMDLTVEATNKAVDAAVAELSSREAMIFGKVLLSSAGYTNDASVTGHADYTTDLGADFTWAVAASATGGTITLKGTDVVLTRTASTATQPGRWIRP